MVKNKSMTCLAIGTMLLAFGGVTNSMQVSASEKTVQVKATNVHNLSHIILGKNGELIKISLLDYIMIADDKSALNGYSLKYLVSSNGNTYGILNYVISYDKGDTPVKVLERMSTMGGYKQTVSNVSEGDISTGILKSNNTQVDEDLLDFEVSNIE